MAYGKFQSRGGKGTSVRLTGLFKTKKPGLFVGSVANADLAGLVGKIKEANAAKLGVTFFLWKNDPTKPGPVMSLSIDLEKPREERPVRRPIQPDDDGEDSLFGDD